VNDFALVVLIDAPKTCTFYLTGDTCLSQLARIVKYLGVPLQVSMFVGHTDAKWTWKGGAT
jgi:hypothetical protein